MLRPKGFTGGIRYVVRLEFCGQSEPRYVARFCDDWLGQMITEPAAWQLAQDHHDMQISPDE